MGMSSSQYNLLSITSRMHDVELKAQKIENQKIELATQQDELYQEYCDALDAKKIQVGISNGIGGISYVDANYNNVCKYNPDRKMQYSLKDSSSGLVIVDEDIKEIFEDYKNDKYSFAWAMLGLDGRFGWEDTEESEDHGIDGRKVGINPNDCDLLMTEVEQTFFDTLSLDDSKNATLKKAYEKYIEATESGDLNEKRKALKEFRDALYSSKENKESIYKLMCLNKNDDKSTVIENNDYSDINPDNNVFCESEYNYYIRLFENIVNSGGCISINKICEDGDTGNEWFNNMVSSGKVLIDVYNDTKKEWIATSVATSTNQNYLQEVPDEAAIKKAEAKYEHDLSIINRKDKSFDRDLNKLETERTALKTEIDSIKQVRNDNIERTFGIFS